MGRFSLRSKRSKRASKEDKAEDPGDANDAIAEDAPAPASPGEGGFDGFDEPGGKGGGEQEEPANGDAADGAGGGAGEEGGGDAPPEVDAEVQLKRRKSVEWKERRAEAAEKTAMSALRKPILRQVEDSNSFLIDCPEGCTTWYTVDQLSADFSTKPRIPGPDVKGAQKAEGGVVTTEPVDIEDGTTSVMCRAIAIRNEDSKESGMAGLEVPTQPALGPTITLNDATGEITLSPSEGYSGLGVDSAAVAEHNFEWTVMGSPSGWAVADGPVKLTEQGVVLGRSQTVWSNRSAVVKFTASRSPTPRMVPVVDKASGMTTAFKVFGGPPGAGVRVFFDWDVAEADSDSRECVDDVIEVDVGVAGQRTLSLYVTQPKAIPFRMQVPVEIKEMPPPELGEAADDERHGLQVGVANPAGFPKAKLYYSWTKKATVGKGSVRVVGGAVPVLANRGGTRTLSVVASYPGHAPSWAEREYDIQTTALPTVTAEARRAVLSEEDAAFGKTEAVGSYLVTVEHENPFAAIVYCVTPADGDALASKPTIKYVEQFAVEADRDVIVTVAAAAPGEAPSETATQRLGALVTKVELEQAERPKAESKPDGVVLTCGDADATVTYSWRVDGGDAQPEQTCSSGHFVPLDAAIVGTHVLTAHASRDGFADSDELMVEISVRQLPAPRVKRIDRGVGVHFEALSDSDAARHGVAADAVDVHCAFGVSRTGGDLEPTSAKLTWTSPGADDPAKWRAVVWDHKGAIKAVPFFSKEYLPDVGVLDAHGAFLHVWAWSGSPGWARSPVHAHPAVKLMDIPTVEGENVDLRETDGPAEKQQFVPEARGFGTKAEVKLQAWREEQARIEEEERLRREAEERAERERREKEEAERKAKEEAERKAKEEEERKAREAEAKRKAEEEAARRKTEEEAEAKRKAEEAAEAERTTTEEAERKANAGGGDEPMYMNEAAGGGDESMYMPPKPKAAASSSSSSSSVTKADIGKRCTVEGVDCPGTVRFVGPRVDIDEVRVGVELDTPVGKNDGDFKGTKYFDCKPGHGVLVRPDKVKLGAAPAVDDGESTGEEVYGDAELASAKRSSSKKLQQNSTLVSLAKRDGESWGFSVGTHKDTGVSFISKIAPSGAASRAKELAVGHELIAVDGQSAVNINLKDLAVKLRSASNITLEVRPQAAAGAAAAAAEHEPQGYYVVETGGGGAKPKLAEPEGEGGGYYAVEKPGGKGGKGAAAAAAPAVISAGDDVYGDPKLASKPKQQQASPKQQVSPKQQAKSGAPPVKVVLSRSEGESWGFSVGKHPVTAAPFISKVAPNGAASRFKEMAVGRALVSADGKNAASINMRELAAKLKSANAITLELGGKLRFPPPAKQQGGAAKPAAAAKGVSPPAKKQQPSGKK